MGHQNFKINFHNKYINKIKILKILKIFFGIKKYLVERFTSLYFGPRNHLSPSLVNHHEFE